MLKLFVQILVITTWLSLVNAGTLNDVHFNVFNKGGQERYNYGSSAGNGILLRTCPIGQTVTLATHGWGQDINIFFAKPLINKLLDKYGGCAIFVEYSDYSRDYGFLCWNSTYNDIARAIAEQLEFLHRNGRNINDSILAGFSYGARLVVNVGIILRRSNILVRRIDALEPAGPNFDYNPILYRNISNAARFSQCIHTSNDYGTNIRDQCTQNWIMGNCGWFQPGYLGTVGFTNHGFSMQYYVSSFDNDFQAEDNPNPCTFPGRRGVLMRKTILMGGKTDEDREAKGVFFHRAAKTFPFNFRTVPTVPNTVANISPKVSLTTAKSAGIPTTQIKPSSEKKPVAANKPAVSQTNKFFARNMERKALLSKFMKLK